ncbi:rhodanese [Telmatospirillum siberiense]|uniref:Rhodanese n=2 Tax=Telmatospirillum siberiense TaxID=382514 RepID=A0A2N3PME0_9PROT|nr:rhodanese [Telmatospirillum siberiense]
MGISRPPVVPLLVLLALGACAQGSVSPPEPAGYREENYRSPVPLTLRGAVVLDTPGLAERLADRRVLLIDVLPREPPPPRLAPDNVWMPPPHEGIPGAVWLPNVGHGRPPATVLAYFSDSLERLTAGDTGRALVFYCRSDCWMSWNAAKRALSLGYRHVFWYRDGIEAWRAGGHPLVILSPFGEGAK